MGGNAKPPPGTNSPSSGSPPGPRSQPVRVRFPVLEQTAVQLGGAFAKGGRGLNERELAIVTKIFEGSVRYDDVRVVRGYFANAPTTLGNHIRIPLDGEFNDSTVAHEMTHVWQYQTSGTGYISNSVCAQLAGIFGQGTRNAAYVVHPSDLKDLASIHELSAERQARVVEQYFVSTMLRDPDPAVRARARSEFWYILDELTDPVKDQAKFDREFADLERMIAQIRRARPLSHSAIYEESMFGPAGHDRIFDNPDSRHSPQPMPLFRIEF